MVASLVIGQSVKAWVVLLVGGVVFKCCVRGKVIKDQKACKALLAKVETGTDHKCTDPIKP